MLFWTVNHSWVPVSFYFCRLGSFKHPIIVVDFYNNKTLPLQTQLNCLLQSGDNSNENKQFHINQIFFDKNDPYISVLVRNSENTERFDLLCLPCVWKFCMKFGKIYVNMHKNNKEVNLTNLMQLLNAYVTQFPNWLAMKKYRSNMSRTFISQVRSWLEARKKNTRYDS